MVKRILVPLDLSPFSQAATVRACMIAADRHAQVTGMTVLDTPEIAGSDLAFHAALIRDVLEEAGERLEDARSRIRDGLERFADTCSDRGVAHSEAEFQGVPADRILETADYYDLLIMGLRTYYHFETQTGPGNSLKEVLNHCRIPLLAVPAEEQQPFRRALVAFDGSPSAVSALHGLTSTLPVREIEVTLLMSDGDPEKSDFYLNQAAAFLRAHQAKGVTQVASEEPIGDVIDRDHIDSVDLVVAGVHGKHRLKDFFLGSLAEALIEYGHTAVLLGQ